MQRRAVPAFVAGQECIEWRLIEHTASRLKPYFTRKRLLFWPLAGYSQRCTVNVRALVERHIQQMNVCDRAEVPAARLVGGPLGVLHEQVRFGDDHAVGFAFLNVGRGLRGRCARGGRRESARIRASLLGPHQAYLNRPQWRWPLLMVGDYSSGSLSTASTPKT